MRSCREKAPGKGASVKRVPPAESGKPTVIAVGRYPFASGFNRQRSQIGVGNKVALNSHYTTELSKDVPMARTRGNHHAVGPTPNIRCKPERLHDGSGKRVDPR